MGFVAKDLDSQHYRDQMHALPVKLLGGIEQAIVRKLIGIEQLQPRACACDITNFYPHIAGTNTRPELPRRGHNKQGRHDLRQLGLALVVDQDTQLPLAHLLYEGARSDMRTFAEFLKPVRERLRVLTSQPQQLTLVFDAEASSKANRQKLETGSDHSVTAVRPSYQQALLAEAADRLEEVALPAAAVVRAWRTQRMIAGKQRDAVVVFSPQLYERQVRGLHQHMARRGEQLKELGAAPRGTPEAGVGNWHKSAAANTGARWSATKSRATSKGERGCAVGVICKSTGGSSSAILVYARRSPTAANGRPPRS